MELYCMYILSMQYISSQNSLLEFTLIAGSSHTLTISIIYVNLKS